MSERRRHWACPESPVTAGARRIVDVLRRQGFAAMWVGGAVRDGLLGRPPHDIDLVTSARPAEILQLFPDARQVGVSFGVLLVAQDGIVYEVASGREERAYLDGRHPSEVKYTADLARDVRRRDFTVNALLYDPLTGTVIDYVGGLDDLDRGVVRTVGPARQRFREDYLRLLRLVRFAARLGFAIDPAARAAAAELAELAGRLAAERVRQELEAILTGPRPDWALGCLEEIGVLRAVLPEVAALRGIPQNPLFHPEGDVWAHTLLMLHHLVRPAPALAWSVLLHDVGKAPSLHFDEAGEPHFYGHESLGAAMVPEIAARLRFSRALTEQVAAAVRTHMRYAAVREMRPAKLARLLADPDFPLQLELHRLDCLSSHRLMEGFVFLLDALSEQPERRELPAPLLTGRDLIAAGFRPGKAFKIMLDAVREAQLAGELADRRRALEFIRKNFVEN